MEIINYFSSVAIVHFAVHLVDKIPQRCNISRDENAFVLGEGTAP